MEVAFRTNKLAKTAANDKILARSYGPVCGKKFAQRLLEFSSADCLEDLRRLPGPRIHELTGDRKGQFSADLKNPLRLIFTPSDDPPPTRDEGGWDWKKITIIEILEVADTHD